MTANEHLFPLLPAMEKVGPHPAARRVAWALLTLLILLAIGLAFTPWQQSISGDGRVIALTPVERQQTISAPVDGRVLRWHVVEGTVVQAGDPIAEIADNDPGITERLQSELFSAREREQSLADRIGALRVSRENALAAADSRVGMAAERLAAAERGLEAAAAQLLAAQQNLDRMQLLLPRGLTSVRSVEVAKADRDRLLAEVERSKNALNAAGKEQDATLADRQKVENDQNALIQDATASRASATAAMRPIETRLARQTTQRIVAPRDGVILRLLAQPGSELLKAGEALAILVPNSARTAVELKVSGNDMPLLHLQDKVRLQFEGWPAIQFVGWPSVAVGTFGGKVTLIDATDDGSGKFRIVVAPDENDEAWPESRYLRQGVRANGWVLLKMVPAGFELWRRFNGFPPTATKGGSQPYETGSPKKK